VFILHSAALEYTVLASRNSLANTGAIKHGEKARLLKSVRETEQERSDKVFNEI
jgi:hypothetical protein